MLAILTSTGPPAFFAEAATVIVAGAVVAYVGSRLGLVTIVGFLIAGIAIGPYGLGIVSDREMVDAAAELGVVLLLFTIGIEFSFEKLARIRRLILGGGTLQVVLAAGVTAGILAALGVAWRAAVFTGLLVSLSSTAIVLKLLADRGQATRSHGQVGMGLLIFQDLAIIPMVLLLPLLAGQGGGSPGDVALALGKAAGIIVAVLVVARRVMPPLLEMVARTCAPELFLLTVIAVCFGTAYLTSLAGVSLSLGAFLAGLVVSESRFSEHALGEILPLQILFSATFFVSVGMLLDLGFLVRHLPMVAAAAAGVLVIKTLTTAASARALGYRLPVAGAAGLLLAQVGEFSFVLNRAGGAAGLSPLGQGEAGSQTFIAATVVLMVATPYLASAASWLEARRGSRAPVKSKETDLAAEEGDLEGLRLENHVVVAGYGAGARQLVRVLNGTGVPFVITTLNPEGAREAEAAGYPVLRGDSARQRTLERVGIERAKVMVIADDDAATASRITTVARMTNPTMRIVVRTRYLAEVDPLAEAGADRVLAEELEAVVQLFADVLREYRVAPEEIEAQEAAVRAGRYAALRAAELPPLPPCPLEGDCLESRTVTVREGAPAAGRRLGELTLAPYGLQVRGLRTDGVWEPDPSDDAVLRPGIELALAGTAEAFARGAPLFRPAGGGLPAPPPPARRRATVDTEQVVTLEPADAAKCAHVAQVRPVHPGSRGCEECLRTGDDWVHLRVCMSCGHVGCCDDSKNRHATAHFTATTHPVMRSIEPGETWGWCFVDKVEL